MSIPGIIKLKDKEPLFTNGSNRLVYRHPDNPELIVKVVRKEWAAIHETYSDWKKRFKPIRENSINMHEFLNVMQINRDCEKRDAHVFTAIGIERTDLGWGMVCELEKDKDGNPARSIESLMQSGVNIRDYIPEFKKFFEWLKVSPVVLTSFHVRNMLMAWRDDHYEWVLVDGIGERATLKMRTYFPDLYRERNLKRFRRMMERLGIYEEVLGPKK